MGYAITLVGPRRVELTEYAEPPLGANEVRIATLYSGISAGTELAAYRGTSPFLSKRWDAARRLFAAGDVAAAYPVTTWGYEEVQTSGLNAW